MYVNSCYIKFLNSTKNVDLSNKLNPTEAITKALTNATSGVTGTVTYLKIGKIVMFYGSITSNMATASVNGQFAGMPKPICDYSIEFPTTGYHASQPSPYVQIRTDRGMRNYACINGTASFSGVYFTSD